jgi:hypothetical protein
LISSAINSWAKTGPERKTEAALARGALLENLGAENVGGHEVGRELDAPRVETEHNAHGLDELGLGQAWNAKEQRMAAGEDGHERLFDDLVLAEDDRPDSRRGGTHILRGRFGRAHDHVFELFEPFAGSGHSQLLILSRISYRDRSADAWEGRHLGRM